MATFTCLSFSALSESYDNTGILQNGLSEDSLIVSISAENGESTATTGSFLEVLGASEAQSFLVYKDIGSHYGIEFFLKNKTFPLPIQTDEKNLSTNQPIIILDQSLLHNTVIRNGKAYFLYKNEQYEVMGNYQRKEKNVNQDSSFFATMDQEADSTGTYYIDGLSYQEVSNAFKKLKQKDQTLDFAMFPLQINFQDRISLVVQDQAVIVILLVVTFFLIAINTISTTIAWLDARRDESYARFLVGATFNNVQWWLLKEYWLILAGSFAFGLIISYGIIKSGIFRYVVTNLNIYGVGLALLFCFVLGTLTEIISTFWKQRKKGVIRKGDL